jgi:integrase
MTKVNLRKKSINGGKQSLYLDFYPPIPNLETGRTTRREFLKLYVFDKPKTSTEKQHNKETLVLAETIKAKRQIAIQNEQFDFLATGKLNTDFVQYFRDLAKKRSGSNSDNWFSALNYLELFTGGKARFADITEKFCNDFKEYLLKVPTQRSDKTTLSQNSCVSYFNKLKATLKQAYKEGYLKTDLNAKIETIKYAETQRQFLTKEELEKLAITDCKVPLLKSASLFSALTGLRFSDIEKLTWKEIEYIEGQGYFILFTQQKTKGVEVLPISEQAYSFLGERKEPTDRVFEGLKYSAYQNGFLKEWIARAGITKDITFHCFRHTYATLQLSLGTDIYTVSKLLGHRDLKTTQVYAKIIDQTKIDASKKIKLNLNNPNTNENEK